ncbi:MAG: TIGR01458 family HAD-type hydrolase [Zetaproteobacteria bacterium]|nr:MAG: TIGR01458 family HAD-type hydrolase [Zetaproteobacteria bacterium]
MSGPHFEAILLDLDGVLYIGDKLIPGAREALTCISAAGMKVAGVTNTTTIARAQIIEKLHRLGLNIDEQHLFTPAALARQCIGEHSARLFVRDSLRQDFAGIRLDHEQPDYVVMGDIGGEGYTPETLRRIFLHIMDGSRLIALHKNRFWQKPDGLHLDLGCFVAAIEYATGKKAQIMGKPSTDFFHGICRALDVSPAHTLMIGDDIESDVAGAQRAGLHGMLVHTGKYRPAFAAASGISPDYELDSIALLPDFLQQRPD